MSKIQKETDMHVIKRSKTLVIYVHNTARTILSYFTEKLMCVCNKNSIHFIFEKHNFIGIPFFILQTNVIIALNTN